MIYLYDVWPQYMFELGYYLRDENTTNEKIGYLFIVRHQNLCIYVLVNAKQ